MQMARATQRPGQTREQTKLIAQGIQKGIDLYKKQQNEKARERNRQAKKSAAIKSAAEDHGENPPEPVSSSRNRLPWILLGLSWLVFAGYLVVSKLI